ncbi:amidohydrolase family protein [Pseudotenacibaculum haliotis]|uniref:Amidohydrolase family protein n=1 Tax=Pseudotenacibaculum haliotis TaxID=1862138 RepID=A0ABW5LQG7_9FLAO
MIIDSHQHFWKYNSVRDSWITDEMKVIQKDFLPLNLFPVLSEHHIEGCIAVQADQSENETRFLLDLANQYSFIKGVVGWVDLKQPDVEERLSFFSRNSSLKGIRHILQAESNDFMLQKEFQNGISKLSKFNLAYDILIYPQQISNSIELVKKFPEQVFVLDHLAKPEIKKQYIDSWKRDIQMLAEHPNVYCKVSGMVTEADWLQWDYNDFTPYLDHVLNSFGSKRLLYGSDWPVCLLAGNYQQVLSIAKDYFSKLSENEQQDIFRNNAIQAYNLQ